MAIVTKGSGGSIKFSGTGGAVRMLSSGGGGGEGGGGGGGGIPDSSNLYSFLRRGINQTPTTNDLSETVISSWTDARGAGLGYPKFLPVGRWNTGSTAVQGCAINGDGSVTISSDGAAGKGTFMRAVTDDANTALVNVTNGSWTVYARFKNPLYGTDPIAMSGSPFVFYSLANGNPYNGTDYGDLLQLSAGSTGWYSGNWNLTGQELVDGSWSTFINGATVGTQYVPNPNQYQTVVLRGSPAQGWSFRLSNSNNSGGSFGSNYTYSAADLDLGSVIWLGDLSGGNFAISDFAMYKSYHDEATASQIISYLETAP